MGGNEDSFSKLPHSFRGQNDAMCDGFFGRCVCTGNHLGEFCEDSCGENGQVVNRFNGSACECSANYTGVFCNLRPGEIAEKEEEEEEEELVPRWLLLRPSSWSAEGTQSPVDASA